jgi:hypothetical protein
MSNDDDDMGFEDGRPFLLGARVKAEVDAIVDDPDATPVLVVAVSARGMGVRVFGPPSLKVADKLDEVARTYRQAVLAARAKQN